MKKAQSSLEFLMTYGWSIMIVLAVLGSLFYLDIVDLSGLLPENTMFPEPLHNTDDAVAYDDFIKIKLKNNIGSPIKILTTGYKGTDDCSPTLLQSNTSIVQDDSEFELTFTCNFQESIKRAETYLSFQYNNTFSGIVHNHTGFVVTNIN